MTTPLHRQLSTWSAVHDNGWTTVVNERPDGAFEAVVFGEGQQVSGSDLVQVREDAAKAAALRVLRTKAGHAECSARCEPWILGTTILEQSPRQPDGSD